MKKRLFFILGAVLLLASCQKENDYLQHVKDIDANNRDLILAKNNSIREFADIISDAINDKEFRFFIKSEAEKMFDGEYNVLYQIIKDKRVNNLPIQELIQKDLNQSKSSKNTKLDTILSIVPNIQIAVPVNIEKWNPEHEIPYIVYLPFDFDDSKECMIEAFKSDGSKILLSSKEPPDFPVIVISASERVDEDLDLKVDESGIVLPKEMRKSAISVYNSLGDKHRSLPEPLVEIVDQSFIDNLQVNSMQIENSETLMDSEGRPQYTLNSSLTPPVLSVDYPSKGSRIELFWTPSAGATGYNIYRRTQTSNWKFHKYVTTPTNRLVDVIGYENIGNEFLYYVTATNNGGESYSSNSVKSKAALRWEGGREFLKKIYMTKAKSLELESWLLGPGLELRIDIFQTNTSEKGSQWTIHNKTLDRSVLADKWRNLNSTIIDSWNLGRGEAYYVIKITEEDNTGTLTFKTELNFDKDIGKGVKVKTGINYQYSYTNGNDDGGSVEVEWFHNPNKLYKTTKDISLYVGFYHSDIDCPYGGSYDGANCLVVRPPTGSKAFIYAGNFYYTKVNGSNPCPNGGHYDGANCFVTKIPESVSSFIYKDKGYYAPGY